MIKIIDLTIPATEMMLQRLGTGLTQVFYITVRTPPAPPSPKG